METIVDIRVKFREYIFIEPVLTDRLYLQGLGDIKSNMEECLRICMTKESYDIFKVNYAKNPFIINAFQFIIPILFNHNKEEKPKSEEQEGIQALINRNRAKIKDDLPKGETSFIDFLANFISKTEQDCSIVNRITYTYLINYQEALIRQYKKEEEKNKTNSN